MFNAKRSRNESLDISFEDEEDDDPLCTDKQKYPPNGIQFSLEDDGFNCEKALLKSTNASQRINVERMENECSRSDPGCPEDLFKPITFKWRRRTNQEVLLL